MRGCRHRLCPPESQHLPAAEISCVLPPHTCSLGLFPCLRSHRQVGLGRRAAGKGSTLCIFIACHTMPLAEAGGTKRAWPEELLQRCWLCLPLPEPGLVSMISMDAMSHLPSWHSGEADFQTPGSEMSKRLRARCGLNALESRTFFNSYPGRVLSGTVQLRAASTEDWAVAQPFARPLTERSCPSGSSDVAVQDPRSICAEPHWSVRTHQSCS